MTCLRCPLEDVREQMGEGQSRETRVQPTGRWWGLDLGDTKGVTD